MNTAIGYLLPLSTIGKPGVSHEENLLRLNYLRDKSQGLTKPAYEKALRGRWTVDELFFATSGGQISVIMHVPESRGQDLPLVIWAHGGGFTINDNKDSWGAALFNDAFPLGGPQCVWASVGYRLAPEHQFPAPVEDIVAAYEELSRPELAKAYGYSLSNISLAGASAGAFLVAHAAIILAKSHRRLASLALNFPVADPRMQSESHHLYGDLPMCPDSWLRWSWGVMLATDGKEPTASRMREANLLLTDVKALEGLRTLMVTGKFDSNHDEAIELSAAMSAAGAEVEVVDCSGSHVVAHNTDPVGKERMLTWCRDVFIMPKT